MIAGMAKPSAEHELERLLDLLLGHAQELAHLLVSRRLSASLYRRVAGSVPPVQLQALSVLAAGDLRMRELAHRLGLAESTVTRLVDRLEAAGLAERRSQRPDRRSILVGLSVGGSETLAAIRKRLRALLQELLAALPAQEQRELLRLLAKLADTIRPQTPEVAPASG